MACRQKKIPRAAPLKLPHRRAVGALSVAASLERNRGAHTIHGAPDNNPTDEMAAATASTLVQRFEELIAGHPYLIEVVPVSEDRWRAYIVRIPGVPNAMMPFYGQTADEAAALLRQWLTRAYERAASGVRRV